MYRMMDASKWAFFLLAAACLVLPAACQGPGHAVRPDESLQSAETPDQVRWTYLPGGLTVNLEADAELNLYMDRPHNLMLCVYQLSGPDAFQKLAEGVEGIRKLLDCAPFDRTVVQAERRFVFPGEQAALVMDRMEGARHVGLVAGYNEIEPGTATALHAFPVIERSRPLRPWSKAYHPGKLNAHIVLGARALQTIGVE
jgi:type VI secretion system VasD/TssJ family lipoprotein